MIDEPIAPVSGKESANKVDATDNNYMSAEDILEPSVLSFESKMLSPKSSAKKCKANLMTLRILNDVLSPLRTNSFPSKLRMESSPKVTRTSNIVSDVQSIVEKTYSDIQSIR